MPQLSDLIRKPKFVKKEFRPWDLSGTGTIDNKDKTNESVVAETKPSTEKALDINEVIIIQTTSDPIIEKTGNITDNKTGNKQVTTRQQSDNIQVTSSKQPDNNEVTTRKHLDNKTDNVTGNADELAYLVESIKKLSGIQKNIFLYVINVCSARGALDTSNIIITDLAYAANCSIGSAKTSLIRLIEKHLIVRLQGKACRGGHMVLGITERMQAAAIQAQQALFNPLKMSQTGNITGNVSDNMGSYSSSIYKNNITTALPDLWKKINFHLLAHIGFSETQLCQLYDSKMTEPEIVQDSINRFAYSLEYSDKVKAYNDPLNVLMGVLRKGQRWNEPNYIPPKELALREMLDEKRKWKEQQNALVKELIELEFPEWKRKLTDEEIKKIVPEDVRKTNLIAAIQATLRTYFTEKVLLPRLDLNEVINH